ncbi:MAG: gamma-glutamyltransferase, partial [Phycisphaerae bacterium]
MEPPGCGLGGDLFAIVWDPKAEGGKGTLFGYNGSGRSPKAMTIEFVKSKGVEEIPPLGPLPVTVPGCVDGWFALHGKFGKLAMQDVLAPAIGYAENGFPMAPVIADAWAISVRRLEKFSNFKEQFTIEGRAPKA